MRLNKIKTFLPISTVSEDGALRAESNCQSVSEIGQTC